MMIENSTPVDESAFGSYGEFGSYDVTADWTDEDWAAYDQQIAEDMAEFDASRQDEYDLWAEAQEFVPEYNPEPPF